MENSQRSAFPLAVETSDGGGIFQTHVNPGLTKREYMATHIVVGLIAANYEGDAVISAIKTADRMLAEMAK